MKLALLGYPLSLRVSPAMHTAALAQAAEEKLFGGLPLETD
jgi:hypothetical protein